MIRTPVTDIELCFSLIPSYDIYFPVPAGFVGSKDTDILDDLGFDAFYELDGEYYGWKRTLPPPYDDFDEGDLIAAEVLAEKLVSNYE